MIRTTRERSARPRTAAALLLAALAALGMSGCERQVVRTDYFPLRDGNHWEYRLLDHAMLQRMAAGEEIATDLDLSGADAKAGDEPAAPAAVVVGLDAVDPKEAKVSRDAGLDEKPEKKADAGPALKARRVALELKASIEDEVTFRATYDRFEQVWSKAGGYVGFQNARGRQYLLILPPHTGYRWVVTQPSGENLFFEVEGHSQIATPAGTFPMCAVSRQESRDKREITRYWFAPDVGLVRRSKYFLDEEVFRQELVKYEVNAALPKTRSAEEKEIVKALKGGQHGQEHKQRSKQILPNDDPFQQ